MTKYYRVRAQEQWNWLMKWFEEQDRNIRWYQTNKLPTEFNYDDMGGDDIAVEEYEHEKLVYGDVDYYQNIEDVTDFIEVSQMMEDEKMEDYVTIQGEDLKNIEMFRGDESKGNLREFWDISKVNIPKSLLYPKVRMSVAEKKEFDELKRHRGTVYGALDMIEDDCHKLYTRLFGNSSHEGESKAQLEFARAWADPSLIEIVEEPKYNIEVPETGGLLFYVKNHENCGVGTKSENHLSDQQFTEKEIIQRGLSKYKRVKAPKQES